MDADRTWCAECLSEATQTVELVVRGETLEKDLCDLHLFELLGSSRPILCAPRPRRHRHRGPPR